MTPFPHIPNQVSNPWRNTWALVLRRPGKPSRHLAASKPHSKGRLSVALQGHIVISQLINILREVLDPMLMGRTLSGHHMSKQRFRLTVSGDQDGHSLARPLNPEERVVEHAIWDRR